MARLMVYGRSSFCPDMYRWKKWVEQHPLDYVEFDIDRDDEAYDKVIGWTGHESVPTLVIAPDDGIDPIEEPRPLGGRSPRAVDRGTMLTEPNLGQVAPFLQRHGIPFGGEGGSDGAPTEARAEHASGEPPSGWRRLLGI
jgi:glutaredoxin